MEANRSQLPHPERLRRSESGACVRLLGMGFVSTKDACGARPNASSNLIRRDLHFIPRPRSRVTERHVASCSLPRSVFRGWLIARTVYAEKRTVASLARWPSRTVCGPSWILKGSSHLDINIHTLFFLPFCLLRSPLEGYFTLSLLLK